MESSGTSWWIRWGIIRHFVGDFSTPEDCALGKPIAIG
jgi:hypothetical protein